MSCCFVQGDSLTQLKKIQSNSIDLIYTDSPFGTTKQVWDTKQDWEMIFKEYFRILKDDGVIALHCSVPFNYELIRAAPKPPSYSWYWRKLGSPTGYLSSNHQPLRVVEEILIWRKKKSKYYRQQIGDEERTSYTASPSDYCGAVLPRKKITLKGKTRTHFIEMKRDVKGYATRPREIVELIIKSYTKEGDIILDPYCYDGLTGLVAKGLGRHWKGIDLFFLPRLLIESHHDTQQPLQES